MDTKRLNDLYERVVHVNLLVNQFQNAAGPISNEDQAHLDGIETEVKHLVDAFDEVVKPNSATNRAMVDEQKRTGVYDPLAPSFPPKY